MNDNLSHYRIGFWTLVLMAAATAVILYQHATHTNLILSLLPGSIPGDGTDSTASPAISANPDVYGATSRASGIWTPLGPVTAGSVFPYMPKQAGP